MTPLARLVSEAEDWLLQRIHRYAGDVDYLTHTSLEEDALRAAIAGISHTFLETAVPAETHPSLLPGTDYNEDPAAVFGADLARRYLTSGIGFEMLFSLMKYYRQSYIDLVLERGFERSHEMTYLSTVERLFDRLEIGSLMAWRNHPADNVRERLQEVESLNAELEQRVRKRTAQLNDLTEENEKKLQELTSLYRMSNTMLSTMRLDKLVHLILTALTSGDNPFFERAMLFLTNERSGTLQGMLGVTRQTSFGLINPPAALEDILASRWDISEADMIRQQEAEFSRQVRASRLELNKSMNLASRAVLEKRLISVADAAKEKEINRDFITRFGIKSCALAPLIAKERVVGVLVVDNALHGKPIARDDLRFLQLITNQAGMAIENSMLYNRIEDANRSLLEARERLVQGERLAAIGEMAASIAHEVKGPLVSIGGFARRLEKKIPTVAAEHDYAATIVREVQRLEKLLTDILSFAKKSTICYSTLNISDIVEDSLAIITPAFEENRIRVAKSFPIRNIALLGDAEQLKQVFLNLFVNAQEAMKEGGEVRITVATTRLNGKKGVSIKIADTGGGIELKALSRVFTSFFTTKQAGTGLGLPIANRIVTNHGGKIQVTNKIGTGAEFNVLLPLTP